MVRETLPIIKKRENNIFFRVGYGSAHASDHSSFQWRFPLAFQGVPAGILAIGLIWFPESPRQLIEKDNEEEALRILKKLHANGRNDEWIMSEFNEIRQTILAEKTLVVRSWSVMFTVPQWRNRLMHGVMVQVFTQLTGISEYSRIEPLDCVFVVAVAYIRSQMSSTTTRHRCMKRWG